MEDKVRQQAERLRVQLAALDGAPPVLIDPAPLRRVEQAALALREALNAVPEDSRPHLTSAELGFMPGPGLDAFVPKHAQVQQKDLGSLAQGAAAVQTWIGASRRQAYREFLVRGYVRGFAHLWREHRPEPADNTPGSAFFEFAQGWLQFAGVAADHQRLIGAALQPEWRLRRE
ncbi:MAG: hypothetical protein ABI567_11405 [Gammaproteobacteria bacterium]